MSLGPGSTIGPFKIQSLIGKGGMGEVFSAVDTRLERKVALKMLPDNFTADAERLQRFQSEARALASLNHPNILSIFEVGGENENPYLVSELLEGETLRDKLNAGRIPQRKAIEYALQMANGLAAAHARGIIHRDLKPENIFITHDGRVKILDFGLAKAPGNLHSGLGHSPSGDDCPTLMQSTLPGVVLGTVGYMSPEQVRGEPADDRSDIFAFGVILYEMLSRKNPFRRDTVAETMTAIIKEEPAQLQSGPEPPLSFQRIVSRCLEKRKDDRFHSAHDLSFALEAVSGSATASAIDRPVSPLRAKAAKNLPWGVAVGALGLLATVLALQILRPAVRLQEGVLRVPLPAPEGESYLSLALSPNGEYLAFVCVRRSESWRPNIWLRSLRTGKVERLQPGAGGAGSLFWSPDSRWIGFFAGGKLKKLELATATVFELCPAKARGGTWNSQGVILFSAGGNQPLSRINANGGEPAAVTKLTPKQTGHVLPYFLPDGKRFLYLALSPDQHESGVFLASLEGGEPQRILEGTYYFAFAAPNHLLYVTDGTLVAQGFDLANLRAIGEQVAIGKTPKHDIFLDAFSVSTNGTLAFLSENYSSTQLTWYDRSGSVISTLGRPGVMFHPALSPDEKWVAYENHNPELPSQQLWLMDTAHGTSTPLPINVWDPGCPVFSPAGTQLLFTSKQPGLNQLYLFDLAGKPEHRPIQQLDGFCCSTDWSAGGHMLFDFFADTTGADCWDLPPNGQRAVPLVQQGAIDFQVQLSPDGKRIAYASDLSGQLEVYVASLEQPGLARQVSVGGGADPKWHRQAKELYYLAPDRKLMVVQAFPEGRFSTPKVLFQTGVSGLGDGRNHYCVSTNDQRFLVLTVKETATTLPLTLVVNWPAEIRKQP